ncbi:Mobile element protein [Burkholderia sp. AU4i]|nr:Mobile element protein [Burkholderia sp. AU4i]
MSRPARAKSTAANQAWSLDFVADQLSNGQRFRALTIIDVFTREALVVARYLPLGSAERKGAHQNQTRLIGGVRNLPSHDELVQIFWIRARSSALMRVLSFRWRTMTGVDPVFPDTASH